MGNFVSDGKGHEETGKRDRKRVRNPELWKRNIAKRRRNSGESYEGRGGKQQRSRKIKKKAVGMVVSTNATKMFQKK